MWNVLFVAVLILLLFIASLVALGALRWRRRTAALRARVEAAQRPTAPAAFDPGELAALPEPVQRYFRFALAPGQPMVERVRLRHRGAFDIGEAEPKWRAFRSEQLVVTQRPGFDWNARIELMPGFAMRVHDAYVGGEGVLEVAALGLLPVVDLRDDGALADGELMRFFAEAAWYPTALLPSQGVRWQALDERSARATLAEGERAVTLTFAFADDGGIATVRADARGRAVGERVVEAPWLGSFWDYAEHGGMRVPTHGEVSWLLPDGARPYWRGELTGIDYGFAASAPAVAVGS